MYDQGRRVTFDGTIAQFQFVNPHPFVMIDVKDANGKVTNWKIEMGNPASLTKAGWSKDKLKVGQMVTLQGWQAKNGTHFASAEEVTMASGERLSAASSYDRGAVPTSGRTTPKPVD